MDSNLIRISLQFLLNKFNSTPQQKALRAKEAEEENSLIYGIQAFWWCTYQGIYLLSAHKHQSRYFVWNPSLHWTIIDNNFNEEIKS